MQVGCPAKACKSRGNSLFLRAAATWQTQSKGERECDALSGCQVPLLALPPPPNCGWCEPPFNLLQFPLYCHFDMRLREYEAGIHATYPQNIISSREGACDSWLVLLASCREEDGFNFLPLSGHALDCPLCVSQFSAGVCLLPSR